VGGETMFQKGRRLKQKKVSLGHKIVNHLRNKNIRIFGYELQKGENKKSSQNKLGNKQKYRIIEKGKKF
jgi:hypothetical protein